MMLNFFCKFFIEGGTNAGVMKHVGEAVKEHEITFGSEDKVNVIGIATWGIVDRKDSLIAPKVKKLKTIVIICVNLCQEFRFFCLKENQRNGCLKRMCGSSLTHSDFCFM